MKSGTYTMVYYQGEYKVGETEVKVSAGSSASKDISGSVKTGTTIFKIGEWDGQYVLNLKSPPKPYLLMLPQAYRISKCRKPASHAPI